MHCKQSVQIGLNACRKFRFRVESVLIRSEMGQIASVLRQLGTENRPSSISIWQVGTRSLANIAGIMHSISVKVPSARYFAPHDSLRSATPSMTDECLQHNDKYT